ncbi:MAG: hypothetical protein ACI32B_07165 [Erysipelotrichaceae bacterium]
MVNDKGYVLLNKMSPETYKACYNGNTSISKVASIILSNLDEDDRFNFYIYNLGNQTAQVLADEFKDYIPDITAANVSIELKELFLTIPREASDKKRVVSKKCTRKTSVVSVDASADQLSSVIQEVEQVQTM